MTMFLALWSLWWVFINTVGRLQGGLGTLPLLGFDLVVVTVLFLKFRKNGLPHFKVKFSRIYLPAFIALGSALVYALLIQPLDWDGLDYHLPPLIEAFHKKSWGNFSDPYYPIQSYPMLVESLYLYWILHFGHRLYLLLGFVPVGLGAVALARICGHLKLEKKWALLLWFTLPIVIKQVPTLYIDNFVGAFALMALVAILKKDEWLFSLALGFFVGAKFSALVPGVILGLGWILRYKKIPWVAIVATLITLGGTLIPNWVQFQNPLYPFHIALGQTVIFQGLSTPSDFVSGFVFMEHVLPVRFLLALYTVEFVPYWDMIRGSWGWVVGPLALFGLGSMLRATWKKRVFWFPEIAVGALLSKGVWVLRYHLWIVGGVIPWVARLLQGFPKKAQQMIWVLLLIQSLWLWSDRVWFLGLAEEYRSAFKERSLGKVVSLVSTRAEELLKFGEPQKAINPVDKQRIEWRKTTNQVYLVCENRPQQIAALYGADFSNRVIFKIGRCTPEEKRGSSF